MGLAGLLPRIWSGALWKMIGEYDADTSGEMIYVYMDVRGLDGLGGG